MPASTCFVRAASKARSKSSVTCTSITSASSASARTAVSVAANCSALRLAHPHLFPAQLRDIKKHSCHIAAGARKTLDVSLRKRIDLQI
jgi:hypothetical protein